MPQTRLVYLTAGAGGMFCGSCMHDNALARALMTEGFDVQLVPTYTPIRTDEENVSVDQVFFGGINVFLQQKFPPLRWLPGFLDRFLDNPALIRRVTSRSMEMPPEQLGKLAVSMLKGTHGNQRKEVRRLCRWLKNEARPDLVLFTNILIGGCIPEIKRMVDVPVVVTLQGDDIFLDSLPDTYRQQCIAAIRELSPLVDGFITHSEFYRDFAASYFDIAASRIDVTPLGIDVNGMPDANAKQHCPPVLGYLARLSPEKGLQHLVDAFIELKSSDAVPGLQLRIAGWLGSDQKIFAEQQFHKLRDAGLEDEYRYVGSVDRDGKMRFLRSLTVLSVPTEFEEPKGLYMLESLAAGVPVVQPDHGCFPELIEATGGGLLYSAGDPVDYCEKLTALFTDESLRRKLSATGRSAVHENFDAGSMGRNTAQAINRYLADTGNSNMGV